MKQQLNNNRFLNDRNLTNLKSFKSFHHQEFIVGIIGIIFIMGLAITGLLLTIFDPGTLLQNSAIIFVFISFAIFSTFLFKVAILDYYFYRKVKLDIKNPNIIDINGSPYKARFKIQFGAKGDSNNYIYETYLWFNNQGNKLIVVSKKCIKYSKGCLNKKERVNRLLKKKYNLKVFSNSGIIVKGL